MAKIAVLLPRNYMLEQLETVLEEKADLRDDIIVTKTIQTSDAIEEARKAVDKGAHIIIARGIQAKMIHDYLKIPVVEVILTTQELGLLVLEAKKIIKKENPRIAIVTFKNTLGDITYFNELFQVTLVPYYPSDVEEMEQMVAEAVKDGADLIIGGDRVEHIVKQYSVPSLFSLSTEDSIRNALDIAEKMSYTADVEKEFNAQVETILDTAFNGVIKIDRDKHILIINRMMEDLLKKSASDMTGKRIGEYVDLEDDYIERVLEGRQESCLTSIQIKDVPLMVMIAPIKLDEEITGAIISCHKLKNVLSPKIQTVQEMYLSGYVAKNYFEKFYSKDRKMKDTIELAKKYALSKFPVLIYGEDETECSQFAQSIHNNSLRKNFPFISINCAHLNETQQMEALFGNQDSEKGYLESGKYGTVYIREIDKLSPACQYQLFKTVSNHGALLNDVDRTTFYDFRLIASSKRDLKLLLNKGAFRDDLYYAINALSLKIPPLRKRPKDVEYLVKQYLKNFKEEYSRYLVLSEDAMQKLIGYSWAGSITQLEAFCERLFLSAEKKNIDGAMVSELLESLYPEVQSIDGVEKLVVYKQPEAEELTALLSKYNGNRSKVAKELGISTTTLWRKMKKYGVTDKV
ncbi:MAG: sigma-54-dependent Fis family transcriptional regulator [Clostridia bacterium]|nr:PrpR N-terminal domain-containing protein [Lachnospiraceae bacterium]NCB99079.1 sigma-54-dependent Fis family transcriptional regulator [Clostridia bacterium]NCD02135.1 sigma-54-dependent Fis family transcriptional regulator [Clostridia bacterium]